MEGEDRGEGGERRKRFGFGLGGLGEKKVARAAGCRGKVSLGVRCRGGSLAEWAAGAR